MGELIRRGEQGMDGVLRFARYLIEKRGVSVDLFEGNFSHLLGAAESLRKIMSLKIVFKLMDL